MGAWPALTPALKCASARERHGRFTGGKAMINSTDASRAQPPAAGRSGLASPRAAPWRDMTRPTLDEMYYDAMKARRTRNPPSGRAWLRLDWFASADADCNECLQNMTSGKCQKPRTHRVARTIIYRHGHQNASRYHDGTELPTVGTSRWS